MYEDRALNEDSGPALPPKTAERNIRWSGSDSVQPPPKHGHPSETEIEAQLGIVRRRPVPPPPEEGGLPGVQQSTFMQTGQAEASGVVVVGDSSKCDTPLSRMESTEQLQFQGVANAESAPDSLSQNVASGSKAAKTYPVPAPRPTLKKLAPVESVSDNAGNSLKKNPVALSSRDGQGVPRAESVVTRPKPPVPKKFDPSRHNTVSVAPPTNASASSSPVRATLCVADSRDNSTQAENPSESENPSSSVIKRPLKVPGKLKVDGLLAEQIKVAMTLRPSIVSAVNLLSSSSEISVAGETVNVPLSSTARTYVESIKAYKNKSAPLSPDGSSSFSSGINNVPLQVLTFDAKIVTVNYALENSRLDYLILNGFGAEIKQEEE
jgi:hypothetical protein